MPVRIKGLCAPRGGHLFGIAFRVMCTPFVTSDVYVLYIKRERVLWEGPLREGRGRFAKYLYIGENCQ